MLNCIYHPSQNMIVVDDEEYERLLKTGEWFKHPTEAEESLRRKEDEQDNVKKRRSRNGKQDEKPS